MAQYLITIQDTLTEAAYKRLDRAARPNDRQNYDNAFVHAGARNQFAPAHDADPNNVARHMMTVAGRTFAYNVERLDA